MKIFYNEAHVNNKNGVKKADLHAKSRSLQGCPSDRIGDRGLEFIKEGFQEKK